jgi:probable rRNA maturation factor
MAHINSTFLGHEGPTDVITFRHGEILVCPHVAAAQARLFGQNFPKELLLYIIHGWLHLHGMDDHQPENARKMARTQNVLLKNFLRYSRHKKAILKK